MWRTELLHPLSAHFPIALLLFGSLFFLLGLIPGVRRRLAFLSPAGRLMLWIGLAAAWLAVWTGTEADAIVSRTLCDPTVLKQHETLAFRTAWFFTAAMAIELLVQVVKMRLMLKRGLLIVVALLLLAGSGYLTYVGHLGASVVFQQGGGVYHPSEDCVEFE